jgi:restriction endonuclease Mrr
MTSKVENTIELVKNSPASFFTKDDVIKLLNDVSDVPASDEDNDDFTREITEEQIDELIDAVRTELSMGLDNNIVDIDSAQFELNGNKIELTEIDIDTDPAEDIAEDAIRNWFDRNIL